MMPWAHLPQKMARWGERAGRRRQPKEPASASRRMQASEGSFMGSDGADRPSERPRQGTEETPFLCYLSPAPFAVILAKTSPYKRMDALLVDPDLLFQAHFEPLRSRLDPLDRE